MPSVWLHSAPLSHSLIDNTSEQLSVYSVVSSDLFDLIQRLSAHNYGYKDNSSKDIWDAWLFYSTLALQQQNLLEMKSSVQPCPYHTSVKGAKPVLSTGIELHTAW